MSIIVSNSDFEIDHVVVGPLQNNVFTIRCRSTGEGLLIDAADEDELLSSICDNYSVRKVITTHGHFDHIGAVVAMRDKGIDILIQEEDSDMLPSYDLNIDDESVVEIGKLRFKILHTPGHTPGSICIQLENSPLLFSGDTLFPGGPGATHFPGGDFTKIMDSIETKLMTLEDETVVLPGHGSFTKIGLERGSIDEWAHRGW